MSCRLTKATTDRPLPAPLVQLPGEVRGLTQAMQLSKRVQFLPTLADPFHDDCRGWNLNGLHRAHDALLPGIDGIRMTFGWLGKKDSSRRQANSRPRSTQAIGSAGPGIPAAVTAARRAARALRTAQQTVFGAGGPSGQASSMRVAAVAPQRDAARIRRTASGRPRRGW
jgi:hypothetical protein